MLVYHTYIRGMAKCARNDTVEKRKHNNARGMRKAESVMMVNTEEVLVKQTWEGRGGKEITCEYFNTFACRVLGIVVLVRAVAAIKFRS